MKRRRTLITSLLLVAALALGIGYAALSDDLQIGGSANISIAAAEEAFEADIYFTKAVISADKGTAVIGDLAVGTGDKDKVTITVADGALKGAGDTVLCTIEVTNAGDLAALATLGTPSIVGAVAGDEAYFTVTHNWAGNTATIAAGGKAELLVTISCVKTPTAAVSATFTLDLTAESVTPLP